jgi:micrococcal nuclease
MVSVPDHWPGRAVLVLVALLIAPGALAGGPPAAVRARVTAVLDGDTIRIERDGRKQTVRLIGVDTPELGDRKRRDEPPQPFAREAASYARHTLQHRRIRMEFEGRERLDRYGRLLAYVFLEDDTFFNRELVRQGYGRAYTRFPFRFAKEFRALQDEARAARRGLWALPGADHEVTRRWDRP